MNDDEEVCWRFEFTIPYKDDSVTAARDIDRVLKQSGIETTVVVRLSQRRKS